MPTTVTSLSVKLYIFNAPISEKCAVDPIGTAMRLPFKSAGLSMPAPFRVTKASELSMTLPTEII